MSLNPYDRTIASMSTATGPFSPQPGLSLYSDVFGSLVDPIKTRFSSSSSFDTVMTQETLNPIDPKGQGLAIPPDIQAALDSGAPIRDITNAKDITPVEAADIIKAAAKLETEWEAGKLMVSVFRVVAGYVISWRVIRIAAALMPAARGPLREGELFLRIL